jgi:CMP-N,N'-diacetyllegionaminic acid synthase
MKIIGLIGARGGSKSIPRKNIKLFANKPLIVYSIEQAKLSKYIEQVYLSTDDNEIAEIGYKNGALVPYIRPKEISDDLSTDFEYINHFIKYLIKNNLEIPDLIVQLRPTYPTRKVVIIDDCINNFMNKYNEYDSLRTIVEVEHPPYKMYKIENNNLTPLFSEVNGLKEPYNCPRQILPKSYWHNGYLDIIKVETVIKSGTITGTKILPYIMSKDEVDDIDTEEQWKRAEDKLLNKK